MSRDAEDTMKLLIQVPCFNEEQTLSRTVRDLPHDLEGVDAIEYLVIDDGSTDRTVRVAEEAGVHHILSLGRHCGLATAFAAGLRVGLGLGADVIVNTDGDNQYSARSIRDLIAPILARQADIVIGSRPIERIEHFSWSKKQMQRIGSLIVNVLSGTRVPDVTSGFRAFSADAARQLKAFNRYTYTLETLVQAGRLRLRVGHVDVEVNPKTRDSRLISSVPGYVLRSLAIIFWAGVIHRPVRMFMALSVLPAAPGILWLLNVLHACFRGRPLWTFPAFLLPGLFALSVALLVALAIAGRAKRTVWNRIQADIAPACRQLLAKQKS